VKPGEIRLGLDRVRKVLAALGHPETAFASVLIGGTNGKGSVASLVEGALRAAGHRTGLFTSPHLVDETERVRVNGRRIGRDDLRRLERRARLRSRRARVPLTEFEVQTLAAFLYFRERRVEIAVVEVGLGGRLDATNALPAPEATVTASIGRDHLEFLGPTLRHVLREKLGICRPGVPHVIAVPPSLEREARTFCRNNLTPAFFLGRDFHGVPRGVDWRRRRQNIAVRPGRGVVTVHLLGPHQAGNAALAAAVCRALARRGWRLDDDAVRRGFAAARWPGRFDVSRRGTTDVILDGAHNPDAARVLARAYGASPWGRRRAAVIFSCLKDKDARAIARALAPLAARVYTVPLSTARGRDADDLAALWPRRVKATPCRGLAEAWSRARVKGPVIVTGSLYLVGDALRLFGKEPA